MLSRLFPKTRELPPSSQEAIYLGDLRRALDSAVNFKTVKDMLSSLGMANKRDFTGYEAARVIDAINLNYEEFAESAKKVTDGPRPAENLKELHVHASSYLRSMLLVTEKFSLSNALLFSGNREDASKVGREVEQWSEAVVDLRIMLVLALRNFRKTHPNLYKELDLSKDTLKKLDSR